MYTVYVLKDLSGRLYKGMTNNLRRRLAEHRAGKTITTSRMNGLEVIYTEIYDNFDDARRQELYLKTAAGRRFLKKVLLNLRRIPRVPVCRQAGKPVELHN